MLKTITPLQMKAAENRVMQGTSITGEWLMQNAANAISDEILRVLTQHSGRVVCFCGTGNNGGDGLAAMRIAAEKQASFVGECVLLQGRISADSERELAKLQSAAAQISVCEYHEGISLSRPAIIVDALFGTGLSRNLEGDALSICKQINQRHDEGTFVLSVDIPSGLDGISGKALGVAVHADETITFHRPKIGLYIADGPDYTGQVIVSDIGMRNASLAQYDEPQGAFVIEKRDLAHFLPKRRENTHKGHYGKVLLFVGSVGMAGAAALSATASLRTGAGLVCIACAESIAAIVQTLCPCATCLPLPADIETAKHLLIEKLSWANVFGSGCGLGSSEWAKALLSDVLSHCTLPTVLDADALNLLATMPAKKANYFITPHPAEAARLLHCSPAEVVEHPFQAAEKLSASFGNVILKGCRSVLTDGKEFAVNPFGSPAMAKGGSGDVLTGIVCALLAQRCGGELDFTDLELMQTACALHGLAGEKAAIRHGQRGVLASDLCDFLGEDFEPIPEEKSIPNPTADSDRIWTVIMEHPLHSLIEGTKNRRYPINCGYIQEVLAERNEWQDAAVWGIKESIEWYEGKHIGTVFFADGTQLWLIGEEKTITDKSAVQKAFAFRGEVTRLETV